MTTYTFAFVIERQPTLEEMKALGNGEIGGDMIFGTEGGLDIVEFDREASDLVVGAISSAIAELLTYGIKVVRLLQPEDFLGCTPSWRPAR